MSVRVDNMITAERRRRGGRHINSGTILVQIHFYSLRPMAGHYYLLLYIALQLARSCGGDCGPFTKCRWRERSGVRWPPPATALVLAAAGAGTSCASPSRARATSCARSSATAARTTRVPARPSRSPPCTPRTPAPCSPALVATLSL